MAQGQGAVSRLFPASTDGSSDGDVGDEEDELDNTKLIPAYAYSTISFQKRQALGKLRPFCSPIHEGLFSARWYDPTRKIVREVGNSRPGTE